jgi:DNA-binding CsgD family transcriptional regulator
VNPQIVGRDESLAELERFIRAVAGGPACVSIEGEAGIGKTTLWQAAVDAAADEGYRLLVSRPVEAETALAYSGLADLLAQVDPACFEVLPAPKQKALEVALLLSEPDGRPPEPRAIFAAFGAVVRTLSLDGPVLIAVDDLQWLDRSSQRALEFVSRRLGDERVGILTTLRLGAGSEERTATAGTIELRLGALSPAALYHLVKARLGVSLPRSTALRIHRTTGGNPFFALELARVLVAADLPGASDPWPVPEDLRDMVAARVGLLPRSVRETLLVASASARPTISGLAGSALRAAIQARIVALGPQGQVRFAHPLFASAIYENASPEERRRAHSVLAAGESDIEERARQLALASDGADESVAGLLHEAAARARARGAPDVAAELEERSFALTPSDRPAEGWGRRIAAAEDHFHAGDLDRARGLLVELVTGAANGLERSRALRLLGEVGYHLGSLDDALRDLRRAIDEADGDPGSVARAELDLVFLLSHSFGSFDEAADSAARALIAAEALGDDALLSIALAVSSTAEFFVLGRGLDEAKLARALSLEDRDEPGPLERRPSRVVGQILLHADELDRARALLESLCAYLEERGLESDLPDLLTLLARLECLAGNLAEAAELAERGYELARQAGSESLAAGARAISAVVGAHMGRAAETRAAAAEAIELAGRSGWQIAAFWASTALAQLELSLGNDEAVVTTLAFSIGLIEERGLVEPSRQPFLPDAIEALIRLGDLERADRLTRQLEERAETLGRPSVLVAGARCRALHRAACGQVAAALEGLERVLVAQPPLPMPLENARTLIVKGQLQRRRKQKRAASESLRTALELCEEIGATLWADRARSELARLGRQPARDDLTATEARVAVLAASGLTNKEIAASAFLSQKTVEANLSRVYRKLRIRSRAELGVRLAEGKPAASRQPRPPAARRTEFVPESRE